MICQDDFLERVNTPRKRELALKFMCCLIKNYSSDSCCDDYMIKAGIDPNDYTCDRDCPLDNHCVKHSKVELAKELIESNYTEEEIFEGLL